MTASADHPPTHTGRTAIVTGAASGLGQAIAVDLASRGADIVAVDLDPADATADLVRQYGRRVVTVQADVSDPAQVAGIAPRAFELTGRVDILVNNAGIFPFMDFADMDFAFWSRTMAVNIDSMFLVTQAVLGSMKDNGWGRIVNIGSNSLGIASVTGLVHYMASKGAVIGFTRALANEVAPFGVTVNTVAPTATRTPGGQAGLGDELLEAVAGMQAIKRVATAEDVTGMIAFLTGEESHFITAQTIYADGGLVRT